jgi:hypothetical protein
MSDPIEIWDLRGKAPIFVDGPESPRSRLVQRVHESKTYQRDNGAKAVMSGPHALVWARYEDGPSGPTPVGDPAYIPEEDYITTFGRERPIPGTPYLSAEKLNGRLAACYVGSEPVRVATNENDPTKPDTWPLLRPGDWIAVGVDKDGEVRMTKYPDGISRPDQYPVKAESFTFVSRDDIRGRVPVIMHPGGRVHLVDTAVVGMRLAGRSSAGQTSGPALRQLADRAGTLYLAAKKIASVDGEAIPDRRQVAADVVGRLLEVVDQIERHPETRRAVETNGRFNPALAVLDGMARGTARPELSEQIVAAAVVSLSLADMAGMEYLDHRSRELASRAVGDALVEDLHALIADAGTSMTERMERGVGGYVPPAREERKLELTAEDWVAVLGVDSEDAKARWNVYRDVAASVSGRQTSKEELEAAAEPPLPAVEPVEPTPSKRSTLDPTPPKSTQQPRGPQSPGSARGMAG